jgi:DNA-binding MarR family transcriptional regulator
VSHATGRRGRRLPTRDELAVWRSFIETAERLRSELETRLQADGGVSGADYSVLLALWEARDHRLRSSTLAERIGWERSRLSHHLGRMERRGLIGREDCATDNRGAEVVLTSDGAAVFRAVSAPHLAGVRKLFVDAFTPEQLDSLGDLIGTLASHLDENPTR